MLGKPLVGLLACGAGMLCVASAETLVSENFSYSDGPLVAVSNGKWKTHSGTAGQIQVSSGTIFLSQKKSEDVSATFPSGPVTATNALAVYSRFKVSFSALPTGPSGGYFAHYKDASATTGLRCRVFATTNSAAPGNFRVGIAAAAGAASAIYPRDLNLRTTYRLVCRMILSNSASTLWLNPAREADSSVASDDKATAKAAVAFAFRESLSSGSGMGELTVDDLVVAKTFAEVVVAEASAPTILTQPQSQVAAAGSNVTLRVEASGAEPIAYQWLFNGAEIPGETQPSLALACVGIENAGVYEVVARNSEGEVTSEPAVLTIQPPGLAITISYDPAAGVRLCWPADLTQTYSVWTSDMVHAEYGPMVGDLWFPGGLGSFEELPVAQMRFYQVCSP